MKIKACIFLIGILFHLHLAGATAINCPNYTIDYEVGCSGNLSGNNDVYLSAINSGGPADNSYTWTWNYGDGSPVHTNTGPQPYQGWHTYALPGNYTVTLTYGGTCQQVTTSVVMDVYKPTIALVATPSNPSIGTPVAINIVTTPSHPFDYRFVMKMNGGPDIIMTKGVPYMFTPTSVGPFQFTLAAYYSDICQLNTQLTITGCPSCAITGISASGPVCVGYPTHFVNNVANCPGFGTGSTDQLLYTWDYGDGTTSTGFAPDHTYTSPGTYVVNLTYQYTGAGYATCPISPGGTTTVVITPCQPPPCDQCIGSFAPTAGNYIIGTWVKQENAATAITYDKAGVKITCHLRDNSDVVSGPFYPDPNGKIIDGWQRIEQKFTVPLNTTYIKIHLVNTGTTNNVYFDDIRIHPVDATMKSFVYDPLTLRLMAELDENNYATFYEYDEEGALIRVKKETERGIMTVKENRNNSSKQ